MQDITSLPVALLSQSSITPASRNEPLRESLFTPVPRTRLRGYRPSRLSPIPRLSFTSPQPRAATLALRISSSPSDLEDSPTITALNRRTFIHGLPSTASKDTTEIESTQVCSAEKVDGANTSVHSNTDPSAPLEVDIFARTDEDMEVTARDDDDDDDGMHNWQVITFSDHEVTSRFLASCHLYNHDPQRPSPTNLDILFRLGSYFGPGITRSELRQAFRRCRACKAYIYADARGNHTCDGPPFPLDQAYSDFVCAALDITKNRGVSLEQLAGLFTVCTRCDHILLATRQIFHDCPRGA